MTSANRAMAALERLLTGHSRNTLAVVLAVLLSIAGAVHVL